MTGVVPGIRIDRKWANRSEEWKVVFGRPSVKASYLRMIDGDT